ncbi:MAG: competence protein ComK [Bacilli bacterium]|nr:competence protein ComK [Bacilli bacterium]
MINNKEILYIKQGNRESIIYNLNQKIIIDKTLTNLLNEWCLEELTTLDGRMEAIKTKFHFKKFVPIYINKELMLMPTKGKKDIDNIYVNIVNILGVDKLDKKAVIRFRNQTKLIVDIEYQKLKKYYERSLKIYHSI